MLAQYGKFQTRNVWGIFRIVSVSLLFIVHLAIAEEKEFLAVIESAEKVDLIWVQKAERKLHLIKDFKIIHSYDIDLGKNAVGHKQEEGDSRTPEGLYTIDGRNPNSNYYLSLHISYPSAYDTQRAQSKQINPGSHIMVHGEPNHSFNRTNNQDWTHGCIALNNHAMQEVWNTVADGTSILIDP